MDKILYNPLEWTSYCSYQSTKLFFPSKEIACIDAFDMANTVKRDMKTILKTRVPLSMVTDSPSLFNVLTKPYCTTEKRLMIYLQTVKDSYKSFEASNFALIKSEFNTSDALTKL